MSTVAPGAASHWRRRDSLRIVAGRAMHSHSAFRSVHPSVGEGLQMNACCLTLAALLALAASVQAKDKDAALSVDVDTLRKTDITRALRALDQ